MLEDEELVGWNRGCVLLLDEDLTFFLGGERWSRVSSSSGNARSHSFRFFRAHFCREYCFSFVARNILLAYADLPEGIAMIQRRHCLRLLKRVLNELETCELTLRVP